VGLEVRVIALKEAGDAPCGGGRLVECELDGAEHGANRRAPGHYEEGKERGLKGRRERYRRMMDATAPEDTRNSRLVALFASWFSWAYVLLRDPGITQRLAVLLAQHIDMEIS